MPWHALSHREQQKSACCTLLKQSSHGSHYIDGGAVSWRKLEARLRESNAENSTVLFSCSPQISTNMYRSWVENSTTLLLAVIALWSLPTTTLREDFPPFLQTIKQFGYFPPPPPLSSLASCQFLNRCLLGVGRSRERVNTGSPITRLLHSVWFIWDWI